MHRETLAGLLEDAKQIAVAAGKVILAVPFEPADVTDKADGSPLTRADLASDVRDTYWNWRDDPRFNAWMTDDRFRYLIPRQDRERFRTGGANAGMRTTSEAVGAAR